MADRQDKSPCFWVKRMPTFSTHPSASAMSNGHSEHDAPYGFPTYTPSFSLQYSAICDSLPLLFFFLCIAVRLA